MFGFFVVRGLRGAADLNDDHSIDLDELFRYVATNTAAWVREASGGREVQTPVLLWGGGADSSQVEPPVLLPAPYDVVGAVASVKLPSGGSKSGDEAESPYASEVHHELSPLAKVASKRATKKVPGAKSAKRTVKTGKKVSKATKKLEGPDQKGANGGKHAGTESKPPANGETSPAPAGEAKPTPAPTGTNPSPDASAKADEKNTGEKNAADKKPDDGKAAAEKGTEKTSEKADATAATDKSKPATAGAAAAPSEDDTSADAAQSLLDAWKWRDKSEAADDQPRPIDYAPQEWHEFQSWLLAEERLDLAGGVGDPEEIADRINKLLARLTKLPHVPPLDEDKPADLAARMAAFAPRLPAGVDNPASLAMAQMFAERGGEALSTDAASASQAIDRFSRDGTLAELSAWVAKLNPDLDRFAEVRLARAISKTSGLDWPAVQLAISAERLGQQVVAIDPAILPWIQHRVESADRLRLAGERVLLDGIGADRGERGSALLRQAIDIYTQAADDAAVVGGAMQLQNDLLNRAPYYVAWFEPVVLTPSPDAPRPAELLELLSRLEALSSALDSADPRAIGRTSQSDLPVDAAGGAGGKRNGGQRDRFVGQPRAHRPRRADRSLAFDATAQRRCSQQFADGAQRRRWTIGEELSSGARAGRDRTAAGNNAGAMAPSRCSGKAGTGAGKTGRRKARQGRRRRHSANPAAARLTEPLEEAYTALHAAIESIAAPPKETADSSGSDGKSTAAADAGDKVIDVVWSAVGRFGAAAREFDRSLSGQVETVVDANSDLTIRATRPTRLQAIRQSGRAIRLVDARDVKQLGDSDPFSVLNSADLYDLLAWQQRRYEAAAADAPAGDTEFLADAARSYRLQAEQIPRQPPLPVLSVMPLQMTGPSMVRLTTEPEQTIEIAVRRAGAEPAPVWLMVDYDPAMIDVQLPTKPVIYQQPELRAEPHASGPAADEQLPLRPDRLGLAASVSLRAGESEPLRLKIRAKPGARQSTRLIVKAISADAYLRHEIEVALPPAETLELTVEGMPRLLDTLGIPDAASSVPESEDGLSTRSGESRCDRSDSRRAIAERGTCRRSRYRPRRHCRLPMRRRCSADSARRRRSHRCRRSPSPPAAASSRCRSLRRRKTKNPKSLRRQPLATKPPFPATPPKPPRRRCRR